MKHIVIHECYDCIYIGEKGDNLTNKEFDDLIKYIKEEKLDEDNIDIGRNNIRFINYVGYIKLKNLSIEILPKLNINKDIDEDKKILLRMILKSNYLNINYSKLGSIKKYNIPLEEIFISLLSNMIKEELNKGIYQTYVRVNENINKFKGKLDLKNHLRNKINNNPKVYCTYDQFSIDNKLNRNLMYIIEKIIKITKNNHSIKGLKHSKNLLGEIRESLELEEIKVDRLNEGFEKIFILAKMILNEQSSNGKKGKEKGYSFLIKINEVFEAYMGVLVKEEFKQEKIYFQHKKYKLLVNAYNNRNIFNLIPDIVIEEDGKEKIIIDTKWKRITGSLNRNGVKREDLYQMYAYLTRYREAKKCILLYPYNEHINKDNLSKWYLEEDKEKTIKVKYIDLRDEVEIKKNLVNIIR